jgi:hypothetical protein
MSSSTSPHCLQGEHSHAKGNRSISSRNLVRSQNYQSCGFKSSIVIINCYNQSCGFKSSIVVLAFKGEHSAAAVLPSGKQLRLFVQKHVALA